MKPYDQKHEYVLGELDMDQVCHCCGQDYEFDIYEERMRCMNPRCSAYRLWFTIPYAKREAAVRHRS